MHVLLFVGVQKVIVACMSLISETFGCQTIWRIIVKALAPGKRLSSLPGSEWPGRIGHAYVLLGVGRGLY